MVSGLDRDTTIKLVFYTILALMTQAEIVADVTLLGFYRVTLDYTNRALKQMILRIFVIERRPNLVIPLVIMHFHILLRWWLLVNRIILAKLI